MLEENRPFFNYILIKMSKQSGFFFQIFVAFSEYLNFDCGHANKSASYFLIDHHWHKKVSAKEVHKSVLTADSRQREKHKRPTPHAVPATPRRYIGKCRRKWH